MINKQNSKQSNTTPSTNIQYRYPTSRFDLMHMSPIQNPNDLYSYYPPNLYQQFGPYDEQNQWGSTDALSGIPSHAPLPYHPSLYTSSGHDIPGNLFEYGPPQAYPHYLPPFTPSTFPGTLSTTFDMPWNSHNQLSIGSNSSTLNKKPSVYDEYPSTNVGISDMLVQHINSIDLSSNNTHSYDNNSNEHTQNMNMLSSKEQEHYQTNSNNLSLPCTTSSSNSKSYALVVSSDSTNAKSTRSISNFNIQSTNECSSNISNDLHQNKPGYNHSYQQQQTFHNRNFLHWTNQNPDRSSNTNIQHSSSRILNSNSDIPDILKGNHQYNPKDFNLNPKGARFFVIKSYSEDDVHRSIKYNIWCSTEHGNKRLDNAFREREGKGPIYLFFSVNGSGHFCGMAEMMSSIDYEHQTDVWYMSNKWQGKFEVRWIYVKDVPNQQFRNIRLENNENKPVTNSRDTQEIPYEKGKLMLKTLHLYQHKTSIFDDFQYYESKQAEEITAKDPSNNDDNRRQYSFNRTSNKGRLDKHQKENNNEE